MDTTTCLEARGTGSGFARSPTWWLISCAHLSQRRKRSRTLSDLTWQRGGPTPPSPPDWRGRGQWCSCLWMRVFLPKNIVSVYLRETPISLTDQFNFKSNWTYRNFQIMMNRTMKQTCFIFHTNISTTTCCVCFFCFTIIFKRGFLSVLMHYSTVPVF